MSSFTVPRGTLAIEAWKDGSRYTIPPGAQAIELAELLSGGMTGRFIEGLANRDPGSKSGRSSSATT
jgi:hypothetical protein